MRHSGVRMRHSEVRVRHSEVRMRHSELRMRHSELRMRNPLPEGSALASPRCAILLLAMSHSVRMLAFAGARDVLGAHEVDLPLEASCTAAELLALVCVTYPALVPYRASLRLAVNGQYADADDPVSAGDEVALIPPVAGG